MPRLLSRAPQARSIIDFLDGVADGQAGLLFEGDAGIGKTTLWLDAADQARARGYSVLSARTAESESVLAHASIADLLTDLDDETLARLPDPQRFAVERALLRRSEGSNADSRAVNTGFTSILHDLAARSPVVVAVDDAQWLDGSSRRVLQFSARRLPGRVGVLMTVRSGGGDTVDWLQMPKPVLLQKITLGALSADDVHAVVSSRLHRSFSRSTIARIHAVSNGNPFYAIELARAITDDGLRPDSPLPATLAEAVDKRIGDLDEAVRGILLTAASVPEATVGLLVAATGIDARGVTALLVAAEQAGVVELFGNRVRFTHPILAHGVYAGASAHDRRSVHRLLAEALDDPEARARHLALAATFADPVTIDALDAAALSATSRGAPAAAAELLDLAVGLGADEPERQIGSANLHFEIGDTARAEARLDSLIPRLGSGSLRARALSLLAFVRLYTNSFTVAVSLLERALGDAGEDLPMTVNLLVMLTYTLLNTGRRTEADAHVCRAVTEAQALGHPQLLSQALSMQTMVRFMAGDGLDVISMKHALALEDPATEVPIALRPSVQNALLLAWTGSLDQAREVMRAIRSECADRGAENELTFIAWTSALVEIWRGDYAEATRIADAAFTLGEQLGSDFPMFMGHALRAIVSGYTGNVTQARRDAAEALLIGDRCGSVRLTEWVHMTIGFADVSVGDYSSAVTALDPLVANLLRAPRDTEIMTAAFVPDAVEALVEIGRFDRADQLITILEANGRRLDRPWMLAVGARCRAMLVAARGDVRTALAIVRTAIEHHRALPMPFERARTELLLGQLQRRGRQRDAALSTLTKVKATFEGLGAPLWAQRADAECQHARFGQQRTATLTTAERRIAELLATGLTNRDVAAQLLISPKTVEATLTRVYRRLGIHSRAELGRHVSMLRDSDANASKDRETPDVI